VKAIIFDLEIVKAILGRNERPLDGVQYCEGWGDHAGMGISVLGALDFEKGRYRVFCGDNREAFRDLVVEADLLVSFNGKGFDSKVTSACWSIDTMSKPHYDILEELRMAHGGQIKGLGLGPTIAANFPEVGGKSGFGGQAPLDWQAGKIGTVIDYCLEDVRLTAMLFSEILSTQYLRSPVTGAEVALRNPRDLLPKAQSAA
jgi:RNase H-like protein